MGVRRLHGGKRSSVQRRCRMEAGPRAEGVPKSTDGILPMRVLRQVNAEMGAGASVALRRRKRRFESCRGHVTELQMRTVVGRRLKVEASFALA
jgi:hypothetical protein